MASVLVRVKESTDVLLVCTWWCRSNSTTSHYTCKQGTSQWVTIPVNKVRHN